jgi:hypothetical protein
LSSITDAEAFAGLVERLYAGEADISEHSFFLCEVAKRSPLHAMDDPGRNDVEARAQR